LYYLMLAFPVLCMSYYRMEKTDHQVRETLDLFPAFSLSGSDLVSSPYPEL